MKGRLYGLVPSSGENAGYKNWKLEKTQTAHQQTNHKRPVWKKFVSMSDDVQDTNVWEDL